MKKRKSKKTEKSQILTEEKKNHLISLLKQREKLKTESTKAYVRWLKLSDKYNDDEEEMKKQRLLRDNALFAAWEYQRSFNDKLLAIEKQIKEIVGKNLDNIIVGQTLSRKKGIGRKNA